MSTCPVCNSPMGPHDTACKACGYRLQETTQEFQRVLPLDGQEPDVPRKASSVPTLTVIYGKQEGIVYPLEGDQATIGRSPKCEVFLNDMTVSRKHALLERVGEGWSIKDADSFNGVWVNNANVDHVMLSDRDVVQIGCFILRYAE